VFAGFISPYGIIPSTFTPPFPLMNYALFWDLLTTAPMLKSAIAELRGTLAMPGFRPWLFLAYVVMLGRTFRWRHLVSDTGNTLACIVSAVLAVSTRRFLPLFGIMALPYFVRHVGAFVRLHRKGTLMRWEPRVAAVLLPTTVAATMMFAVWRFPLFNQSHLYIHSFPACSHLADMGLSPHPPRDHIRVLVDFNYGAWCRWVLYQERPDADFRVTTDGRTQWVPIQRYFASFAIENASGEWLPELKHWDPDVMLVRRGTPLANVMRLAPGIGSLVFEDDQFDVFLPVTRATDAEPRGEQPPTTP
jgi:hypothetical protein